MGRWVDQLIMRSIDTLMAFPYFLLAVAIIAALGPGLVNGMVAVAVVNIPFYGRIVRATVLAVKQTEYVEARARPRRVRAAPGPRPTCCATASPR